ncbi:MAG: hypothetical protein Kow0069_16890 [Promethearchaeota archaeon]
MATPPELLLWLAVPVGLLVGVACGVVGYSAWPLVVPLTFVVGGHGLYESILTSVLVDLLNSALLAVTSARRGDVDVKEASRLGGLSVVGVLAGAAVAFVLLDRFTDLFRGGVGYVNLLLGAFFVHRGLRERKREAAATSPAPGDPAADGGRGDSMLSRWRDSMSPEQRRQATLAFCTVNAFLVGVIGFGGGFNVVLFLVVLLGIPPLRAVGTAMLYAVVVLSALAVAYLAFLRFTLPTWPLVLAFGAFSAVGLLLGTSFAKRLPEWGLYALIGVVVVVTGIAATFQALIVG